MKAKDIVAGMSVWIEGPGWMQVREVGPAMFPGRILLSFGSWGEEFKFEEELRIR